VLVEVAVSSYRDVAALPPSYYHDDVVAAAGVAYCRRLLYSLEHWAILLHLSLSLAVQMHDDDDAIPTNYVHPRLVVELPFHVLLYSTQRLVIVIVNVDAS
jgi:hypothetical protein